MKDRTRSGESLTHHMQRQQKNGGRVDSVPGRVLAASSAVRGTTYARHRRLTRIQSTTGSRERSAVWTVPRILRYLASPFIDFYYRFIHELTFLNLPLKAGLAAGLCSLIFYVPGPLSFLNKNANWAVITADICLGANVGLSLTKGLNRASGTLAAAVLALVVVFLAEKCGQYKPFFMVFCAFWGGALPTMFKFRPPFNDRWNYAVVMSMITFHILILTASDYEDKIKLPLIRLVDIIIGFFAATLISLIVKPQYAGNDINELVAKNFERTGNVMERCVIAFCEGSVLEHVSDIRSGKSEDDNIHTSFHEIVSSDAEVGRLLEAVPYEPCHGKFFFGYPWRMYADITQTLRYALYDVAALDSCLRAEIQAPMHLRTTFEEEFQCIGKECAQVFRLLGQGIRQMRHVHCYHQIRLAEEGALLIQHKISKYLSIEFRGTTIENETAGMDPEFLEAKETFEESIKISFEDAYDDHMFATPEDYFNSPNHSMERSNSSGSTDSAKSKRPNLVDGHEDFLQRRKSIGRHWNTTIHRISVLSLIKFASILIELVAKAKYVVTMVDELEIKARFAGAEEGH